MVTPQNGRDGSGGNAELIADPLLATSFGQSQRDDGGLDMRRRSGRAVVRSRRPVQQAGWAFLSVAAHPSVSTLA